MNFSPLSYLPTNIQSSWPLLAIALVWSLLWKGWALWKSAKQDDKWWFAALLVINTLGILEIVYIYVFSKRGSSKEHSGA